jgi:hypothetical protein
MLKKLVLMLVVLSIPLVCSSQTVPPVVNAPEGYVELKDSDTCMFREDLFIINDSTVGYWVPGVQRKYSLNYRTMKYDSAKDLWYFGQWRLDNAASFRGYRKSSFFRMKFFNYIENKTPKYYQRFLAPKAKNIKPNTGWQYRPNPPAPSK